MVGDYFSSVSNLVTTYCLLVMVITSNNHHTPFTVKALIIFMNSGLLVGLVLALRLQPVFDYPLFFTIAQGRGGTRHNSLELFMFCVLLYWVQSRGGETRRVWQQERKEKGGGTKSANNATARAASAALLEWKGLGVEEAEEEEERSSGLNMQHVAGWSSQLHDALRLKSAVNK